MENIEGEYNFQFQEFLPFIDDYLNIIRPSTTTTSAGTPSKNRLVLVNLDIIDEYLETFHIEDEEFYK